MLCVLSDGRAWRHVLWGLFGHWQYALSVPCISCDHTVCTGDMGTFGLRDVCMMSGRVGVMHVGAVVSSVCRIELSQLDGGVREPLSSRFYARQSRASRSRARRVVLSRQKGSRRLEASSEPFFQWERPLQVIVHQCGETPRCVTEFSENLTCESLTLGCAYITFF